MSAPSDRMFWQHPPYQGITSVPLASPDLLALLVVDRKHDHCRVYDELLTRCPDWRVTTTEVQHHWGRLKFAYCQLCIEAFVCDSVTVLQDSNCGLVIAMVICE